MQKQPADRKALIDDLNGLRRRVEELETAHAQLRSIYDAAQVIILAHDVNYQIVYMNPRACRVLGYRRDEMIGQPMDALISDLGEAERGSDLRIALQDSPDKIFHGFEQYLRKKDGGVVLLRWDISALQDANGNYAGIAGIGQDITDSWRTEQEARQHREHLSELAQRPEERLVEINEQLHWEIAERRRVEREREKLIAELQDALSHVQTLRGLVPICASCKKIRDDDGFWHQVEVYVRDHSLAEFSHALCPECIQELYPEYRPDSDLDSPA